MRVSSITHDTRAETPPIRGSATAGGRGGRCRVRLCRDLGGAPLRPHMRGRPRRHRALRLAPPGNCWKLRRRSRIIAGDGEQGSQEEGGEFAAEVHLRRRRRPAQVVGVRDLPDGVRRRRRGPGAAAVRPRVPRGVRGHVASVALIVPLVPRALRCRRTLPEVRPLSGGCIRLRRIGVQGRRLRQCRR